MSTFSISTQPSSARATMWSSLVNAMKTEYNAIRVWPQPAPAVEWDLEARSVPRSAYESLPPRPRRLKSPGFAIYRQHNLRISQRTLLRQDSVVLQGWPSRGGVIILENATPPDFDFLHLDSLDRPLRRDSDQTAEDAFCQALLRLGATWWDSEARRDFVRKLENGDEEAFEAVDADESLGPSRRERGWVRVAWPSRPQGSLCVLACEKIILGCAGNETLRPRHHGIVALARTMDERCDVLQRLGGIMYASLEEYEGATFLKAWEEDHHGEKGPLIQESFNDPSSYGGYADDALGFFGTSKSSD